MPRSRANGPGTRFVIWSQGCTLGCAGCFNPDTHDPDGPATAWQVGDLVDAVLAEADRTPEHLPHAGDTPGGVPERIEGVTLTGGEPLEQPAAVTAFCAAVRARSRLGIVVLTGFTRGEIAADPARSAAVAAADMVIAGRYNPRRHLAAGLRGSDNQEYWPVTGRYREQDFAAVPDVEVEVAADGTVTMTGLPAAAWDGAR